MVEETGFVEDIKGGCMSDRQRLGIPERIGTDNNFFKWNGMIQKGKSSVKCSNKSRNKLQKYKYYFEKNCWGKSYNLKLNKYCLNI